MYIKLAPIITYLNLKKKVTELTSSMPKPKTIDVLTTLDRVGRTTYIYKCNPIPPYAGWIKIV